MNFKNTTLLISAFLVAFSIVWFSQQRGRDSRVGRTVENNAAKETAGLKSKEGQVFVGGVWRPKRDVVAPKKSGLRMPTRSPFPDPGRPRVLPKNSNPNVESISNSVGDPEKLKSKTVFGTVEKFNSVAFENDPTSYLEEFAPSRVWQVLPEGDDTPKIKHLGDNYSKLVQGESAVLKVQAVPNMPVTFYSNRLGQFENKLAAITVAADKKGVATTAFKASDGTKGLINIIAGSPVCSGHAKFLIKVSVPNKTGKVRFR